MEGYEETYTNDKLKGTGWSTVGADEQAEVRERSLCVPATFFVFNCVDELYIWTSKIYNF